MMALRRSLLRPEVFPASLGCHQACGQHIHGSVRRTFSALCYICFIGPCAQAAPRPQKWENDMLRTTALTLFLAVAPVAAFAHMCPALMSEIDAALPAAQITDEQRVQVTELRQRGADLHAAGDHDGSVGALNEAKAILGL